MNEPNGLFVSLDSWAFAEGFGINTNLLETNLINLAVVIGVLVYFGKGLLSSLLNSRRDTILTTIRDAEERYQEATERFNQAQNRLQQARIKAEEIRQAGLSQMERERQELIRIAEEDPKRLDESKNATIRFEEQRAIEQVRQKFSSLALERALEALKGRLNSDLHARMIDYQIGLFKAMSPPKN